MTRAADDGSTITVRFPFKIRKRGGRKLVLAPEGQPAFAILKRVDNTSVKAMARAFRWRQMLENGNYCTIEELAAAEGINSSYVSRVLRMTLLAPDIVDSLLNGTQSAAITLDVLMKPFPMSWQEQLAAFT